MSKSSQNLILIAVLAGIVVIGGVLMFRGTPEPADTESPVAISGTNFEVLPGETFKLDGSQSTDNVGIVSYTWQLGDLSEEGETVTFTLDDEGIYVVTLIVEDEAGNTGQDTVQITVEEPESSDPEPEPTPDPEPEPTPEPPPDPEPETLPAIDGIVSANEYMHITTDSSTGITVSWTNTEETIYVALESPGTGYVSIGFDPDSAMSGANFIFGYVTSEGSFARDEYGTSLFGHGPDTSNGGTDDIIEHAGMESEGTTFEFSIPLDSGDSKDKPLTPGSSYSCLLAYSGTDNFTTKHSKRGSVTITLD